jgi:hypothetical protein
VVGWVLLLTFACTPGGGDPTATSTTAGTTTTDTVTTSSPVGSGCDFEQPMVESGNLAQVPQPSNDSEQIGFIGWSTEPACETFTVDLVTAQGAPATTPPSINAAFLRDIGVIRLTLDLNMTAIEDQVVETQLVDRIFVVRATDGSLFIDFHLAAPALAAIEVASNPGALVIALEPGGSPYPASPQISTRVVLITPTSGSVESPFLVEGYSRNFEANVVFRLRQGGEDLLETFTTAADWVETWGSFSTEIDSPVTGEIELFVGEDPPSGGPEEGVVIELTVE